MFAGLTTNSSLTPPIGRLTTPTTGGVNSTSGLDLSSLATTRLQTTSYQTPPMPRPSGSHLAPSLPLQPTRTSCCCCTDTITSSTGRRRDQLVTSYSRRRRNGLVIIHTATSPAPYSTNNNLLQPTQSSWANWSGGGQSTGATPTTALEPRPQGSILQPTPSQLSSSSSSTMGWSSGCQLSTAAGTSPLLVPTAHQTAFPRQPALGDNPFADNIDIV